MGLAASQARLLFLTSRKSDVEYGEMKIANEKISLSRDSEKISENYANSLNAKKIEWAIDGSTTNDQEVDLTYNLLMRPNNQETDHQYIYTSSSTGRVVLDNKYAALLGNPTGNAGEAGSLSKFVATAMGVDESAIALYLNTNSGKSGLYSQSKVLSDSGLQSYYGTHVTLSGKVTNKPSASDISTAVGNFQTQLDSVAGKLGPALISALSGQLGSGSASKLQDAVNYAKSATYNKFVNNTTNNTSASSPVVTDKQGTVDDISGTQCEGSNQLMWCWWQKDHGFWGGGLGNKYGFIQIDASQLIDTFLDYFDQACATAFPNQVKSNPSNTVGATSTTRDASSNGLGVNTESLDGDSLNNNGVNDKYEITFYTNLFNAINTYGWTTNDNVTDKGYLQNQILNGNLAIKELQSDGSWTPLSSSDPNSPMRIEKDTEAITAAEAKYNTETKKLNIKEEQLDLKLKNLDTERAALDTEIDSVKSIISKNIERSFKMFQA